MVTFSARLLSRWITLWVMVIFGTHAHAESMSLGAAMANLWQTHPDIQQAEAAVRASGYEKASAYAGFYPYLQTDMVRGSQSKNDFVVRAVLPLWSGGQTVASLDVATASQKLALADLQRTRLKLSLRLTDAYFAVVAYREQDALWRKYLEVLTNLSDMIKRRAAAGASPQADVVSIISRLRQADASAELNWANLAASEAQLMALLDVPVKNVDWPLDETLLSDADAAKALPRALEQHPDLEYARITVIREQADTRVKRAGLSPELSLRYVKPFGEHANNDDAETQVVLQYQTNNGIKAYQAWRAGAQRITGAQSALDTARRDITSEINVAFAERKASVAQLGYQSAAADAADAVIASFLRQFEAGRKSWLEVLNAQREALDTRLSLVQQRRSLWQANTRLALHGLYWDRVLQEADASVERLPSQDILGFRGEQTP